MGIFSVPVTLRNPAQQDRQRQISLMVDTGSLFTWVGTPILEELGIAPMELREFRTITGALIKRQIGYIIVAHNGRSGAMNVVFAEPGDMEVLGVTALETLTMTADPIKQVLSPIVALAVSASGQTLRPFNRGSKGQIRYVAARRSASSPQTNNLARTPLPGRRRIGPRGPKG